MKELFGNIMRFIRNVWKWKGILWNDRNYDSGYLFDVMKFKVDDLYNGINHYQNHVDYEDDLRWLRITSKLIERVNTEWYICEYQDYRKQEIYDVPLEDRPDLLEIKFRTLSDNTVEYYKKYKNSVRQLSKLGEYTTSDNYFPLHLAHHNHEKAKRLLFRIMEEKIESWWD